MRADENSDSAFLLVSCTFLSCIAAPWSLGLLISLFCSGIRDKDGKIRRGFLISLTINILIWLLIYYIVQSISEEEWLKDFDPYAVLEVTRSSTMSEIKRKYRKLSLQWHPDKNKDSNAKKIYFLLNKAKDILTDPVKKDNFMKYGNPDGPRGGHKMSIALPTFLFDKNNQIIVLCVFAVFILVIFPVWVYRWFSGTQMNADPETGVNIENLNIYMKEGSKKMRYEQIIPMFSRSFEFFDHCRYAKNEEVPELNILLNQIPKQVKEKYKGHPFLKNIVLIYTHIMNLQLADKNLKKSYDTVRKTVPRQVEFLINKMLEFIILYYHNQFDVLVPINNVYMLADFLKKYLHRVHSENGLELFTEELSFDTIEALQSKGGSLKSLENKSERDKMIEKLKLTSDEADTLHQYYEGQPKFSIGEWKTYVKDSDRIEEGDLATIDVSIQLDNHENAYVADNMLRTSFNYPGQEGRIHKIPYLYIFLTEKNGKMINYRKVPFSVFDDKVNKSTLKKSVVIRLNTVFGVEGEKKLTVKIFNDTYLGTQNLDKEFKGKYIFGPPEV